MTSAYPERLTRASFGCYVCGNDPNGCERCRGGPGEQGLAHDESQLLELRDTVRRLQGEKNALWDRAIERAAQVVDRAEIVPGLAIAVRALKGAAT